MLDCSAAIVTVVAGPSPWRLPGEITFVPTIGSSAGPSSVAWAAWAFLPSDDVTAPLPKVLM